MRKVDIILACVAMGLLFIVLGGEFALIAKIFLALLLITYVVYWKFTPHKTYLSKQYKDIYDKVAFIAEPISRMASFMPKVQVGHNLKFDLSHILIIAIILIIIIIL